MGAWLFRPHLAEFWISHFSVTVRKVGVRTLTALNSWNASNSMARNGYLNVSVSVDRWFRVAILSIQELCKVNIVRLPLIMRLQRMQGECTKGENFLLTFFQFSSTLICEAKELLKISWVIHMIAKWLNLVRLYSGGRSQCTDSLASQIETIINKRIKLGWTFDARLMDASWMQVASVRKIWTSNFK